MTEISSKENKSNHREKTNKQKNEEIKILRKKIRDWENKSRRHKLQIIEFPN